MHGKINHVADNFFYRLGYWVATHPKATLAISLSLVIACCFGFANFEVESDGEKTMRIITIFFGTQEACSNRPLIASTKWFSLIIFLTFRH